MGNLNRILVGTVLVALLLSLPLSVFAIAKPPTPQQFTVQYESKNCYFHITIKNIDYDLPAGYDIQYNVRILAYWNGYYDDGSYKWDEPGLDCAKLPGQDPSGYTTFGMMQPVYKEGNKNDRIDFEVRAVVCHYELENASMNYPIRGALVNVSKVDATSDWSSPQSVSLDTDGATGVPTSVEPDPDPTQTTEPYNQYPPYPTATPTQLANQLTALLNSNWEKLALLAMAAIIAIMAVGLVMLWRKVGNLADQKHPKENST